MSLRPVWATPWAQRQPELRSETLSQLAESFCSDEVMSCPCEALGCTISSLNFKCNCNLSHFIYQILNMKLQFKIQC